MFCFGNSDLFMTWRRCCCYWIWYGWSVQWLVLIVTTKFIVMMMTIFAISLQDITSNYPFTFVMIMIIMVMMICIYIYICCCCCCCRYLKNSNIFPPTVTAKIHDLLRSLGSQEEIRCGHGRPLSPWFRSFILHSSRACDPWALQRRPVESEWLGVAFLFPHWHQLSNTSNSQIVSSWQLLWHFYNCSKRLRVATTACHGSWCLYLGCFNRGFLQLMFRLGQC